MRLDWQHCDQVQRGTPKWLDSNWTQQPG